MGRIQFKNQYPAELASDLTTGATSLVLKSGHGANFPEIANGVDKYFLVTAVDKIGNREIIKIIMRSAGSDTLIVGTTAAHQPSGNVAGRAQESTSALGITYTDDHVIELRLTAGLMDAICGPIPATTAEMQATVDPYPASTASLATDMAGVIQRLHYLIVQITGKTYWYQDPDISLATLATRSVPTGAIVLFESDTAITGYTLLTNIDDFMVYVTKGSGASGEAGGTSKTGGTWTLSALTVASHTHDLSNHTHTGPEHTHTGPLHVHTGTTSTENVLGPDIATTGTNSHNHTFTTDQAGNGQTGSAGTGATGVPSNNNSGSASPSVSSAGTWRPPGRNFTRQQRN